MVSSMSILCLWDIHLTFDLETHGAYHCKSKLKCCKGVQEFFFKIRNFVSEVIAMARSTCIDISVLHNVIPR